MRARASGTEEAAYAQNVNNETRAKNRSFGNFYNLRAAGARYNSRETGDQVEACRGLEAK